MFVLCSCCIFKSNKCLAERNTFIVAMSGKNALVSLVPTVFPHLSPTTVPRHQHPPSKKFVEVKFIPRTLNQVYVPLFPENPWETFVTRKRFTEGVCIIKEF